MKYQSLQGNEDKRKWLRLETTLGTNDETIRLDIQSFVKLIQGMDSMEKLEFEQITSISPDTILGFEINDQTTLRLVLLRKFISSIGLPIINEAIGLDGQTEQAIFLRLSRKLLEDGQYPEDIFAYSKYRGRGTPNTLLSINDKYTRRQIETTVDTHIPKIINKINYHMSLTRRYSAKATIDNLVIYLFSKTTSAKVIQGEKKNVAVQGASYSFVLLDLNAKRIGVVSGSKREIQIIQSYLMHRTFDEALAPPRNDVIADGNKLLHKLIKPENEDLMLLQSLELRKTALHNSPSLKVKVHGNDTLDEALVTLDEYWSASQISDVKQIDFGVPTGRVEVFKKLGLYTYGDEWRRTYFNTSTRNVTNIIEQRFLEKISKRLDDNDIKSTRFILEELDHRFIIDKFLRDKLISTNPAIPEEAERMIVELTKLKIISKQEKSIKRKCWNCFAQSWDQWECPVCGRDEMRIVNEAIKIKPNEAQIMRQLGEHPALMDAYETNYYPKKNRRKHTKSVVGFFDSKKNVTTFAVLVSTKKDVEYVQDLSQEGFGVVAIIDPKIEARQQEIENAGCTAISLIDIFMLLIGESTPIDLVTAITDQEKNMLQRIVSNARGAVRSLANKTRPNYDERIFEVDLKSVMNLLVPDVVRLGTEYSGTSVPDGYLRYGTQGIRTPGRAKRLFGWDAKYSQTAKYSLSKADTVKQKSYIRWLMDKKNEPRKFGQLGIYAIIANFDDPRKMNTVLTDLGEYMKLKRGTRIALIDDMLLVKISDWLLDHWQQVLENNSLIADEVFAWFRRPPGKKKYTTSSVSDWPILEAKLDKIIE